MSGGQLDRPDAEVAAHAVELHLRVPCRARRLLVGGEQGILERADERLVLDALLLLDLPDRFQNLPAHCYRPSLVDQIAPHDRLVRDRPPARRPSTRVTVVLAGVDDLAAEALPAADLDVGAERGAAPDGVREVLPRAERALEARRRDVER